MNKLWIRLSLGFSGMVLAAVFVVALAGYLSGLADRFEGWNGHNRFTPPEFVNLVDDLSTYYQIHQSWAGSDALLLKAQAETVLGRYRNRDLIFFLMDDQQQVVYHLQREQIGKPSSQLKFTMLLPIQANSQTVGYLGLVPAFMLDEDGPPDFLRQLGRNLFLAAGAAGLGGILFGVLMSRTLTAPLNRLAEAARAIGARNLSRRVEEKGSDEMIAVARAFNDMAATLEQGEKLRRNLLADVAHELRTPLSVLQGNLRAILDEVYPLNQDEIARLYEHTRFLSRLVNDLHELAQAEARQLPLDRYETDLVQLVETAAATFRPGAEAKSVALRTELPDAALVLQVDPARITQVLQNLLANALRHTPAGGTITVRLEPDTDGVQISVADTGEGIPLEHLAHVFDRFYRADPARSRDRGGAGLGLAIARAIVETHGGKIGVTSAGLPGQGTTFVIYLPGG